MKRSEINKALKELEAMCEKHCCYLPPFCHFTPEQWQTIGHEYDEVRDCMLGWDITDFGMGDFDKVGFSLITIRNGNRAMADKYPKVYAEKLLYLKEGQTACNHFHWYKTEDIINRGGGNVLIRVYNSLPDEEIDYESDVTVHTDGRTYTVPAGTQIRLTPGESIHIQQYMYHDFAVEEGSGPVLLGEVSQCNDDNTDNRFNPPVGRFPTIEEDEAPYRLLCNEYPALRSKRTEMGTYLRNKTFSILGDSYSTFRGYIPEHYRAYYPAPESVSDVLRVEDTWWHMLTQNTGMRLLVNDSYSGSTVCTQVRQEHPAWVSYVQRAKMVDFGTEEQPAYILVFGGTNDNWLERKIGQSVYEDRTDAQLEQVLPAFCQVLETLKERYPDTRIVAVINTDLNPEIQAGMEQSAAYYKAATVVLENIEKQNGHPTAAGMASIARQIGDVLQKDKEDTAMPDVVALGELLIDFTNVSADAEGYPTMAAHPGGAPANFLAALSKFGAKAALLGKVGNDTFGKLLTATLEKAGICTKGLVMADDVFTTLAFVTLDETGNREFAFARKPGADTQLSFEEIDLSLIDEAKVFHFGTLSLTGEPARTATYKAVAYAKAHGKLITYDPNLRKPLWNDLEEAKSQLIWGLTQADVVKISDEEVEFLFGLGVEEGAKYILEQFPVKLVFVTCGAEGCFFKNAVSQGHVPSLSGIKVADTTGAGDIFGGSAVWKLLQCAKAPEELNEAELRDIVSFACTAAGLSTTKHGGVSSVPDINEVQSLM